MGDTTHFNKVSGKNGVYGGVAGSEVQVATAAGTLSQAGTTITSTGAELNKLTGVTATANEINKLAGLTSTVAELNLLAGISRTKAQLQSANRKEVAVRLDAHNAAASTATFGLMLSEGAATLVDAQYIPDSAFSTSANSWALNLLNVGTLGTGTDVVATIDMTAAVANLVALKPRDFGSLSNATIAAGGVLAAQVQGKASGDTFPAGVVMLSYTL